MKIAACLSGNGRTAAYCLPYLKRFFQGHDVDWFVHAWADDCEHVKLYDPVAVSQAPLPDSNHALERQILERFQEFCFLRLLPMYWGIGQALSLVPDSGYDLVVRLRPDIIPHQRLNAALGKMEEDSAHFAYHMQDPIRKWRPPYLPAGLPQTAPGGFNDLLFYGSPEAMRPFRHLYDSLSEYCRHPYARHFEAVTVLYSFLEAHAPRVCRAPITHYLIDPSLAHHPLALYDRVDRARPRFASDVQRIRQIHPDLSEISKRYPTYNAAELWFIQCWSYDPLDPSPVLSPSVRRMARKEYLTARKAVISARTAS